MESKLQALKVPELKKILQDHKLTTSGTKAELIQRILADPTATASVSQEGENKDINDDGEDLLAEPPETKSVDQPKGQGSQASGVKDPESHVEATSGASVAAQPLQNVSGKDEETRKSEMIAELEKRKARAQRWGMPLDDIDAQIQRINRFGIPSGSEDSLKVLDSGLVGKKGGRGNANTPKDGKPNASANKDKKDDGSAAGKTPALPLDPVEEEKKRKRLERFGNAPQPTDKKVKT